MNTAEEVKKIVRSLLVSSPVKVTVASLNNDYRALEGINIPFRELGFNSLLHFLHSIPDVLKVNGSSLHSEVSLIVSDKTAHVNDMVMKQKRPSKGRKSSLCKKSVIVPSSVVKDTYQINNQKRENKCAPPSEKIVRNVVTPPLSPFPRPLLYQQEIVPTLCKRSPDSQHNLKTDQIEISKSNLIPQSKLAKLKLRRSLKKESLPCSKNLTVTFINDDTNEEKGRLVMEEGECEKRVPLEIQNNLKIMIANYPCGLLCTKLPFEYKKIFRKDIDFEKYGFPSLISLCLTLENILYCHNESSSDFRIFDKTKPIPDVSNKSKGNFENSLEVTTRIEIDPSKLKAEKSLDWNKYSDSIPENVVQLGEEVLNNSLDIFKIGDNIQIVVSEIYSPTKFWVYKDDGILNQKLNSLQNFYREDKQNYIIPEFLLEVGLYCVVKILKEFERGLIVDLLVNIGGHVKVYLIDYGSLAIIPRERILFLDKEFSTLPAQAIKTSLDGIEPVGETWTDQSSAKFREFVRDKHIQAKISCKENHLLKVYIADQKFPCKFLNDVLVEEGLAKYTAKLESKENCSPRMHEKNTAKFKLLQRIRAKKQTHNTSIEE